MKRADFLELMEKLEKDSVITRRTPDQKIQFVSSLLYNPSNSAIVVQFTYYGVDAWTVQQIIDTISIMNGNVRVVLDGCDDESFDVDPVECGIKLGMSDDEEPKQAYVFYRRGMFHL